MYTNRYRLSYVQAKHVDLPNLTGDDLCSLKKCDSFINSCCAHQGEWFEISVGALFWVRGVIIQQCFSFVWPGGMLLTT